MLQVSLPTASRAKILHNDRIAVILQLISKCLLCFLGFSFPFLRGYDWNQAGRRRAKFFLRLFRKALAQPFVLRDLFFGTAGHCIARLYYSWRTKAPRKGIS